VCFTVPATTSKFTNYTTPSVPFSTTTLGKFGADTRMSGGKLESKKTNEKLKVK